MLSRLFGGSGKTADPGQAAPAPAGKDDADLIVPRPAPPDPDTEALRRIVAQLDALPIEQRKFVAGFAYVLGRVADADMNIQPEEMRLMEQTVQEIAGLPEAQAVLVVQIALNHSVLYGGTDDYVITREFAGMATRDQLERLLHTAFAVGAADDNINAAESAILDEIGRELGFSDQEVRQLRAEFKDKFGAVRAVRLALETEDAPASGGAPAPGTSS